MGDVHQDLNSQETQFFRSFVNKYLRAIVCPKIPILSIDRWTKESFSEVPKIYLKVHIDCSYQKQN